MGLGVNVRKLFKLVSWRRKKKGKHKQMTAEVLGKVRTPHTVGVAREWMQCKNVLGKAGKAYGHRNVGRKSERSVCWDDEMRALSNRSDYMKYI